MKFIINYTNIKSGVKHAAPLSKKNLDILKSYNNIIWRIDGLKAIKGGRVVGRDQGISAGTGEQGEKFPCRDRRESTKMKTLAQQRLEQVHAEYLDLQSKEMELKAQAAAIEKKAREYNCMKAHKGDILAKLGSIDTKLSYVEYQQKMQALKANVNNVDDWKEEKEKIYKEYIELVFTPCKPRNWYCIDSRRWNNEARRYYIRIENYSFSNNNIERYDTTRKDYYIVIQERPELKRYKWEIEASYPDRNKYRENITKTTKYKTLEELAKALPDIMAEVEQVYKEHYSELFTIAPDVFDFETIRTEVDLPFEVKKNVIKVKEQ